MVRQLRPEMLLRVEFLALLALTLAIYRDRGESWLLFVVLFLTPDPSFLAAIAGPGPGIATYNLAHAAVGPAILAALGVIAGRELGIALALIWFGHLAMDRAIGYGLKHSLDRGDTHLGRISIV